MKIRVRRSLCRGLFAMVLGTLVVPPAHAGDEDIFSAQVPPNVLLFVDNSGSMNAIMEHPSFDRDQWPFACDVIPASASGTSWVTDDAGASTRRVCASSGCRLEIDSSTPGFLYTPDPTDHPLNGYVEREYCGRTRRLYGYGPNEDQGNRTWYYEPYLEWLFSLDETDGSTLWGNAPDRKTAAQILNDLYDPANGRSYVDGSTFGKFMRTRIQAAREIAGDVIYQTNSDCPAYAGDCGVYEDRVRFGVAKFDSGAHGGYVSAEIEPYSANKTALDAAIDSLSAETSTPLGESLFKLYTFFMSRTASDRPFGKDGSTRFPEYGYRQTDGDWDPGDSRVARDPVTQQCQRNFVIMLTDGEPTSDTFTTNSSSNDQGFADFKTRLIGDYFADAVGDPDIGTDSTPEEGSPPWGSSGGSGYLDDVADFMTRNDCRPDFPGDQSVDLYTVGFGTFGPVNALLKKAADNGDGLHFEGNQAEVITEALVTSIEDIISKSQGFAAATVPAARTSDGGSLYTTFFQPTSTRPFWPGVLRSYRITAAGDILDANGDCALEGSTDPADCKSGAFEDESIAPPLFNAGDAMPAPDQRDLFVSIGGTLRAFDHTNVTDAVLGNPTNFATDYPPAPYVTSDVRLADAIVGYAAGCEWGTGTSTTLSSAFDGCVPRTRTQGGVTRPDRLGDIFHSNPVVVGAPNAFIDEPSYGRFATAPGHYDRQRLVYAGANDGFLHAFDAGSFDPITQTWTTGTGAERFAFMPYGVRSKLPDLVRSRAAHPILVDGSPVVADVWIDSDLDDTNPKTAAEWSTVLVGGLREGGEHYYALDVTDPTAAGFPGYLWEFPAEVDVWHPYVAQTWSEPVITKMRFETASGDVVEKWVAIIGFGYSPKSDPNATGLGGYDPTSTEGRGLAILDIETGRPLAVRKFGTATGDVPDMLFGFAASPGVLDYDQDGFADIVFAGDLGGNVWKWVVRGPGIASPTAAQLHQPAWSFRKFFDHDPTITSGHERSFFAPPSATLVGGVLYLGIGSGERANLLCSSTRDGCSLRNRFYVLKDGDPFDLGALSVVDGRAAPTGDLTDVTAYEASCPVVEPRGYFFEAADGEKFTTRSEIFASFFFASSFQPDLANACEPSGLSKLYGFLAKCGQGFFGTTPATSPIAGDQRSLDTGKGFATDPRLSIAPGSGGNRLIISKQTGEIVNIDGGVSSALHGLMYWREVGD